MHAWNPMCSGANFGTWFGRSHPINVFPSYIQSRQCHKINWIRSKPLRDDLRASKDKIKKGLQNTLFGLPV